MNFAKSLLYSIIIKSKVIIFSKSSFICKSINNLSVKTQLQIGKKWNKTDKFYTGVYIGKNAKVLINNLKIFNGCRITIKDNAVFEYESGYLNCFCQINCKNKISIGKNCIVGNNVIIRDNNSHSIDGNKDDKYIKIGDHVWIGTGAIILPGAKIGNGCVVAAGTIVNKEFPDKCLIGGVPAKIIKENVEWGNYN